MIIRVLICGGRTYGKIWSEEGQCFVTNAEEVHRFHKIMGRFVRAIAEREIGYIDGNCSTEGSSSETSRDYIGDTPAILDKLKISGVEIEVIHGAAKGADEMAGNFANLHGLTQYACPAEWDKYGKRAGFIRNSQMLTEYDPDCVIAFPGGNGTKMMADIAQRAGKPVWRVRE